MKIRTNDIPNYDYLGNKINEGDEVVLFSKDGPHYEGTIVKTNGTTCVSVNKNHYISGIGSCYIFSERESPLL